MQLRDLTERFVWTVLVAGLSQVAAASLLGVETWKAAASTGIAAGLQVLTLYGRSRLAVLPDPGAGLPGLPTDL